jgi:hypothetical protein
MPRLFTNAGRIVARIGRLLDETCADACCVSGEAIKFTECCDGDPVLWVWSQIAEHCASIGVGDRCYANTGERASIADLERSGIAVLRQFTTGDGCRNGCGDERCRACPTACCLVGYVAPCRDIDPRRCCVFGSAYRLDYTERTTYRRVGYDCGRIGYCVTIIDGGGSRCIGYDIGVVEEWEETLTATVFHAGTDALGNSCSGYNTAGSRYYRKVGRVFEADGYTVQNQAFVVPINPRYRDIDDRWADENLHFARGEMPTPEYVDVGQWGEACDAQQLWEQCERTGTELDPCPSDTNPLTRRRRVSVVGSWDCSGGRQTVTVTDDEYGCPRDPNPLATRTERITIREWRVVILSNVGCEVTTCADALPGDGSGGLIGAPVGGCVSCRQSPGL